MARALRCERPDRDQSRTVCGYPLPCPHHTVISEPGKLTIPPGVSGRMRRQVKDLHAAMHKKKR